QEFVLRTLEERDIRFVRLWFTDVLGTLKSVSVAPAELEAAFAEGIGFDGSSIEGFARVHESDMIAMPDPATFPVFPYETSRDREFVPGTLEERDIRFVRLWFTDVLGTLKSVSVAPAELEAAFAEGIGFDGSSIEGFARVHESDMIAMPDPTTFQVFPYETS